MSPAVKQVIDAAEPAVVSLIEQIILDIFARKDPKSAAEWHAEKAAHSLATEKALDAEGTL